MRVHACGPGSFAESARGLMKACDRGRPGGMGDQAGCGMGAQTRKACGRERGVGDGMVGLAGGSTRTRRGLHLSVRSGLQAVAGPGPGSAIPAPTAERSDSESRRPAQPSQRGPAPCALARLRAPLPLHSSSAGALLLSRGTPPWPVRARSSSGFIMLRLHHDVPSPPSPPPTLHPLSRRLICGGR